MTTFNPNTLYQRTQQGDNALKNTVADLTPAQRKLLSLLDGSLRLSEMTLNAKLNTTQLQADGAYLLELNFIEAKVDNLAAATPSSKKRGLLVMLSILIILGIGLAVWNARNSSKPKVANNQVTALGKAATEAVQETDSKWLSAFQAGTQAPVDHRQVPETKTPSPITNSTLPLSKQPSASNANIKTTNTTNATPTVNPTTLPSITSNKPETSAATGTNKEAAIEIAKLETLPVPKVAATSVKMLEPAKLVKATPKLLNRTTPEFPREAITAGVSSGHVKARLTINPQGLVSKVEVIEAQPRRIFDRAVIRALSDWKFEETGEIQIFETEISFKQ